MCEDVTCRKDGIVQLMRGYLVGGGAMNALKNHNHVPFRLNISQFIGDIFRIVHKKADLFMSRLFIVLRLI